VFLNILPLLLYKITVGLNSDIKQWALLN